MNFTDEERRTDLLRLTEPRSEIFAADEDSDGVQCKGAKAACIGIGVGGLFCPHSPGQAPAAAEFGFNRILPGWTNYSTAFNATHEPAADGEFATVASFFTPPVNVRPIEYGVVMVWAGPGGQRLNFSDFTFKVFFWSSLEAFVRDPRRGAVATFGFTAPTGGSTTVPDAVTRGGRAAYHLRFNLGDTSLVWIPVRLVSD